MSLVVSNLHERPASVPVLDQVFPDWRRLQLSVAAASGDPNAILNVPATEDGTGIILAIKAGAATAHPDNGAWWTWRARDILGREPLAEDAWMLQTLLEEQLAPTLGSAIFAQVGFCEQSSLQSASANGFGGGVIWAATRTARAARLNAGAFTYSDNGAPAGAPVAWQNTYHRAGRQCWGVAVGGLDASGFYINNTQATRGGSAVFTSGADLYLWLGVGRRDVTASVQNLKITPWAYCCTAPDSGRTPA